MTAELPRDLCKECNHQIAEYECNECKATFCKGCDSRCHQNDQATHIRTSTTECQECHTTKSLYLCSDCNLRYCTNCFEKAHNLDEKKNHCKLLYYDTDISTTYQSMWADDMLFSTYKERSQLLRTVSSNEQRSEKSIGEDETIIRSGEGADTSSDCTKEDKTSTLLKDTDLSPSRKLERPSFSNEIMENKNLQTSVKSLDSADQQNNIPPLSKHNFVLKKEPVSQKHSRDGTDKLQDNNFRRHYDGSVRQDFLSPSKRYKSFSDISDSRFTGIMASPSARSEYFSGHRSSSVTMDQINQRTPTANGNDRVNYTPADKWRNVNSGNHESQTLNDIPVSPVRLSNDSNLRKIPSLMSLSGSTSRSGSSGLPSISLPNHSLANFPSPYEGPSEGRSQVSKGGERTQALTNGTSSPGTFARLAAGQSRIMIPNVENVRSLSSGCRPGVTPTYSTAPPSVPTQPQRDGKVNVNTRQKYFEAYFVTSQKCMTLMSHIQALKKRLGNGANASNDTEMLLSRFNEELTRLADERDRLVASFLIVTPSLWSHINFQSMDIKMLVEALHMNNMNYYKIIQEKEKNIRQIQVKLDETIQRRQFELINEYGNYLTHTKSEISAIESCVEDEFIKIARYSARVKSLVRHGISSMSTSK